MENYAVIYHNPQCGTSRNVLKIIQDSGYQIKVIEYINTGWEKAQLLTLFNAANLTPRSALRKSKTPAEALGLLADHITDEQILDAMLLYPILVNRPIVQTLKGTMLCRPSETVLDLLDNWPSGPYYKEDGELVIDEKGKRCVKQS